MLQETFATIQHQNECQIYVRNIALPLCCPIKIIYEAMRENYVRQYNMFGICQNILNILTFNIKIL